jgi:hypothetical protein
MGKLAVAAAKTSMFALIFCQVGVTVTDTAVTQPKPDYAVTATPYLPIKRLQPAR